LPDIRFLRRGGRMKGARRREKAKREKKETFSSLPPFLSARVIS